jgi:glycosyltransferase involved in cell wall biosynthesis
MSDPRKNLPVLLRSYRALIDALPDAPPLVLAGNRGPTASDLELARSLGIGERMTFHENVSEAELVELYRGSALYVLSSDEEGLGLVILEAMACGCPVVSTDCGGPSTSVVEGRTGFLVPTGDHAALAERMRALLADPDRRERMGRLARARTVEKFSLEATGRLFVDWYDEVLR